MTGIDRKYTRLRTLAEILAAILCVAAVFSLDCQGLDEGLAACYPLSGSLTEQTGRTSPLTLLDYENKTVDPVPENFVTDSGENGIFNVKCLSLAAIKDNGSFSGKDYTGRFAAKIPAGFLPRNTAEATVSLWYKSSGISATEKHGQENSVLKTESSLITFGNTMNSLSFSLNTENYSCTVTCNGQLIAGADKTYDFHVWRHICLAIKENIVSIYIDGQKADAFLPAAPPREVVSIINQGGYLGDGGISQGIYANAGWYSDFRVYQKALDKDEIKALWEGGQNGLLLSLEGFPYQFDKPPSYNNQNYFATVDGATENIAITAITADPNAGLTVNGKQIFDSRVNLSLSVGENNFDFCVVSSIGRKANYTVSIFRLQKSGDMSDFKGPSRRQESLSKPRAETSAYIPSGSHQSPYNENKNHGSKKDGYDPLSIDSEAGIYEDEKGGYINAPSQTVIASRAPRSKDLLAALAIPVLFLPWGIYKFIKKKGKNQSLPPWI